MSLEVVWRHGVDVSLAARHDGGSSDNPGSTKREKAP